MWATPTRQRATIAEERTDAGRDLGVRAERGERVGRPRDQAGHDDQQSAPCDRRCCTMADGDAVGAG